MTVLHAVFGFDRIFFGFTLFFSMVLWFVIGPDSPLNEDQFTEVLLFVKERKVDETSFVRKILIVKTSKRLSTLHSNIETTKYITQ